MVEQVEELCPELQSLRLGDEEVFMNAHVSHRIAWATKIARATRAECVRGRQTEGIGVPPLNVSGTWNASNRVNSLVVGWYAAAVRPLTSEQRPRATGSRRILETDCGRDRVAGVPGNDSTDFPVADYRVDNRVHAATESLAPTKRKLVARVAAQDVSFIVVARSPIGARVIDILPARQSHRGLRPVFTPCTSAEEAR